LESNPPSSNGESPDPDSGRIPSAGGTRIDRWLCATRLFKSRTSAQEACEAGHVSINDVAVKPSRTVQIGDTVKARAPRGQVIAVVLQIEEKRQSPERARMLYEDRSPPPEPRDGFTGYRPRGAGRPTKADRRAMERLRGNND
jgi:ribosome-associated heat shock protein Hsp15